MTDSTTELQELVRKEVEKYASLVLAYQNPNYDPAPLTHLFNEQADDWDFNNAVCLVKAAALAYLRRDIVELEVSRCPEPTQFKFFEGFETDTQAFVIAFDDSIIVSFRGTETEDAHSQVKDLMTDTEFKLVDFKVDGQVISGAEVHKGFQSALDEIWAEVLAFIESLIQTNPKMKIWLTGHSLGGALATVAAARIIASNPLGDSVVGGLYTIGQPRVGNQVFAEIISQPLKENRVVRLVNNNDLVTMLPPTQMGYWHICGRRYINDKGELTHNMSDKLIKKDRQKGQARWLVTFFLTLAIKKLGFKLNLPSIISDHDRYNYLALVRKAKHLKILHKDQEFTQQPLSGFFSKTKPKSSKSR